MPANFGTYTVRNVALSGARWRTPPFLDASYRQTSAYALEAADADNAQVEFLEIVDGDNVVAQAIARVKRLPLIGAGIVYIHHGPLFMIEGAPLKTYKLAVRSLIDFYCYEQGLNLGSFRRISPYRPMARKRFPRLSSPAGWREPTKRSANPSTST